MQNASGCIRFLIAKHQTSLIGFAQRMRHSAQALIYFLSDLSQYPLNTDTKSTRKTQIDALLRMLPGASGRKINGLDAQFVSDKIITCICGEGVALRLPVSTATELQFSRNDVVPFQPGGVASTREWIQINHTEVAEYERDLALFQASLDFVRTGRMP